MFAGMFDQFKMIAADCRVALCGEGADNLMHFEMMPYAKQLVREIETFAGYFRKFPAILASAARFGRELRRRFKGLFGKDPTAPLFPRWLAPEFAESPGSELAMEGMD